jgi:cysteine desulfurase/selenocysteine lyase
MSKENYLTKDGFLDVPRIVEDGAEYQLFSGLLPNVREIRQRDFPLFEKLGRVYLDSTATTQEPQSVKDRMHEYRSTHIRGSNHSKNSEEAREAQRMFDEARKKIEDFFNAHNYFIGFTAGTTDTSNFIATRFPFKKDDTLLITEAEHNSQILTARNFAKAAGAEVKYVKVTKPEGRLDFDNLIEHLERTSNKKGKILLNLVHASNVTGVINPVEEVRDIMRETVGDRGLIYLDMAQSAGHIPIDLDELDIDYASFSGHKTCGPMGVGGIIINKKSERYITNKVSGGSAVRLVSKHFDVPCKAPEKFEPGTQNLEGAIELGYAIDYLKQIGIENIRKHDEELGKYFIEELQKIKDVRIYGPTEFKDRIPVVTFNIGSFRKKNYDTVERELDKRGISVRGQCFCAHTLTAKLLGLSSLTHECRTAAMKLGVSEDMLKLPGAVRVSFAPYNDLQDAYKAVTAIREISEKLEANKV